MREVNAVLIWLVVMFMLASPAGAGKAAGKMWAEIEAGFQAGYAEKKGQP